MMRKLSIFLIALLLLLTACGGNSSSGSDNGKDGDTIRIGAIYPLTGNAALLGEESFRGAELAVEELNLKGGINGKKIELVKGDGVDPEAAQSEANRLINKENIKTIVGSYSSGISYAATEVAERNGVLYWELGAVADNITDRGYKSVLRINPTASSYSKVHIDFIKNVVADKLGKSLGDLKVAIVYEDSSYGTTIAEEAQKLAKEEGINIVSVQPYSQTSNDLSSVILNIKKANPDVIIAVSYVNDAILLTRQMNELGVKVPVFIGSGGGHSMKDYQEAVGDLAQYVFNVDFPQYNINKDMTPGQDDFIAAYQDKYGTFPRSAHSLVNYMGMKVVLDIIAKNDGKIEPEKLRELAIEHIVEPKTTETGWGVEFDEKTGQNKKSTLYVHQWVDGILYAVYPSDVAVKEPHIEK